MIKAWLSTHLGEGYSEEKPHPSWIIGENKGKGKSFTQPVSWGWATQVLTCNHCCKSERDKADYGIIFQAKFNFCFSYSIPILSLLPTIWHWSFTKQHCSSTIQHWSFKLRFWSSIMRHWIFTIRLVFTSATHVMRFLPFDMLWLHFMQVSNIDMLRWRFMQYEVCVFEVCVFKVCVFHQFLDTPEKGKKAPRVNCFHQMYRTYIKLVISRSEFRDLQSAVCVFEVCVLDTRLQIPSKVIGVET